MASPFPTLLPDVQNSVHLGQFASGSFQTPVQGTPQTETIRFPHPDKGRSGRRTIDPSAMGYGREDMGQDGLGFLPLDVGASDSMFWVKDSIPYILRAGDLEKNFQVGTNTDPRESPGSQSGLQGRWHGIRDRSQLLSGDLDNGLRSEQWGHMMAC